MSETAQAPVKEQKETPSTIIGRLTQEPFDMDNGTTIINLANESEGPEYLKMFLDEDKKAEILGSIEAKKGDRLELRGFINPPKKEGQNHTLFPLDKAKLYVPEKLEFRGTMIKADPLATIKPKDGQTFEPYEKGKFTVVVEGNEKEFHKVEASNDAIKGIKALPVIEDLKDDPKRGEKLDVFVKGEVARRRYDFKDKEGKQVKGVATYVRATKVVIGTDNINKYQATKTASKKR